jgi:methanogenic corrinoid protein MtbC1
MSIILNRPGYSIAAVSKLTGVSCHALRVWERRYGFPVPERSPSGHRRYSQEQVATLTALVKLHGSGRAISELIGEYQAGQLVIKPEVATPAGPETAGTPVVDRYFRGEINSAEALLDELTDRLSAMEMIERVIEPAMIEIGERWFRGEAQIFQERVATHGLMARLNQLLDRARRDNPKPQRSVIISAVKGDQHSGGVLMASVSLEASGWRAIPLGSDVPVEQIQMAVDRWKPNAIALSFVLSRNINKRFRELSRIQGVPVFVAGRSIVNHQGLARRYGLIPLVGSLRACTTHLISEVESRVRPNSRVAGPGG